MTPSEKCTHIELAVHMACRLVDSQYNSAKYIEDAVYPIGQSTAVVTSSLHEKGIITEVYTERKLRNEFGLEFGS